MLIHTDLEKLMYKYVENTLTVSELEQLNSLIHDPRNEQELQLLIERILTEERVSKLSEHDVQQLFADIMKKDRVNNTVPLQQKRFSKTTWLRWAAILLLFLGASVYYFITFSSSSRESQKQSLAVVQDVMPGTDKAILTLSSGEKIELTDTTGRIILDGNLSIQNSDGQLLYKEGLATGYNTMTTPKGGQYQLRLSDGTRVWLNSASSITYPIKFTEEKERKVFVRGEAFFDVVKDARHPFVVVTSDSTRVEVLGTAFNIYDYDDIPSVKVSLVEGSVKIKNKVLRPGQAFADNKVVSTNIAKDIAWKNGIFDFQDADIEEVMRQFERWYNIEVIYEKGVPDIQFFGKMGRDLTLSSALKLLKKTKVNFRLEENNRLVILP